MPPNTKKLMFGDFLTIIFGFLGIKNFPGAIFRVIESIFLSQVEIFWRRVPPSRNTAVDVFWFGGQFLVALKNRVPNYLPGPEIWYFSLTFVYLTEFQRRLNFEGGGEIFLFFWMIWHGITQKFFSLFWGIFKNGPFWPKLTQIWPKRPKIEVYNIWKFIVRKTIGAQETPRDGLLN